MTRKPALLDRRSFLRAGAGATLLAACGGRGPRRVLDAGSLTPTPAIADPDDDGGDLLAPLDATPPASCTPTAANIEGPYFRPGAPAQAVLAPPGTRGQPLVIRGLVLGAGCAALAGARLDLWQADHAGAYDQQGWRQRGRLQAAADGSWRVDTIVPGRYLDGDLYRPAHVHVKLAAPGHRPLTTQLYFEGDPYNDRDRFIVDSLVMRPRAERGVLVCRFDFVLAAA